MVSGIFKQDVGPPLTGEDGFFLPLFCIKGVIINYPLYYFLHQYRQNLGE